MSWIRVHRKKVRNYLADTSRFKIIAEKEI